MRLTFTGHAGVRIATKAGRILCDPWMNPAYHLGWYPFPANRHLDWDRLGDCDYLYISGLRPDRFDPTLLAAHVPLSATVLLPAFPLDELRVELTELGFTSFLELPDRGLVELAPGVGVMAEVTPEAEHGPCGSSVLWIEDNGHRVLKQHTSRLPAPGHDSAPGTVDMHLLAVDESDTDSAVEDAVRLGARRVVVSAGSVCRLDPELWDHNAGLAAAPVLAGRFGERGMLSVPGTVVDVTTDDITVVHPVHDVTVYLAEQRSALPDYQRRMLPELLRESGTWAETEMSLLSDLRHKLAPVMAASTVLAPRIGGTVRLDLTDPRAQEATVSYLLDFPTATITPAEPESSGGHVARITVRHDVVESLCRLNSADWTGSLFVSGRARLEGTPETRDAIRRFFGHMSLDRLAVAEHRPPPPASAVTVPCGRSVLAFVQNYLPERCGGPEVTLHALLRDLVTDGWTANVVLADRTARTSPYVLDGITVHPHLRRRDLLDHLPHADVVVTHLTQTARAVHLAHAIGVPTVHICHSESSVARRFVDAGADLTVFNTHWIRDAYADHSGPALTVHPPVDPASYRTRPGDAVTLVNLHPNKGTDVFYTLAERMPEQHFIGVIGGYGEQDIRNLPNVEIIDHTPDMRNAVYARTRVILMPSIRETYGRVAVEALASGIPVIASPTTGLREALGTAGTYLDRDDIAAWESAVRRLADRGAYAQASAEARLRSKELTERGELELASWRQTVGALIPKAQQD